MDGATLASGSFDKTIKLWKVDGALLKTLVGDTDGVTSVAWSPDSATLASGGDKTSKLWQAGNGTTEK